MTVSRVINESGYVNGETREKVLQTVKELNYRGTVQREFEAAIY